MSIMKFLIGVCILFFTVQDVACDASFLHVGGARHVLSEDVKPSAPTNDIIVDSSTAAVIQVDPPPTGSSIVVPISGPALTTPLLGGSSVAAPISSPALTSPLPVGSSVAAPEAIDPPPVELLAPSPTIPPSTPPPTPVPETPPSPPTSTCSCKCVGQGDAECGCSCSVDTNNKFHILFH
jgi:hypothetical protein